MTIHSLGANVRLFAGAIEDVQLLGASAPVKWVRKAGGLKITLPKGKPCRHAFTFKITGLH